MPPQRCLAESTQSTDCNTQMKKALESSKAQRAIISESTQLIGSAAPVSIAMIHFDACVMAVG